MTLTPLKELAYRFHRINYDKVVYKGKGRNEKLVQPDIGFFRPPAPTTNAPVDLKRDYAHRGLQVIVKLANIHLTPEKPEYEGGSWHVEGQIVSLVCFLIVVHFFFSIELFRTNTFAPRRCTTTTATTLLLAACPSGTKPRNEARAN
jgi:hypothetical protein